MFIKHRFVVTVVPCGEAIERHREGDEEEGTERILAEAHVRREAHRKPVDVKGPSDKDDTNVTVDEHTDPTEARDEGGRDDGTDGPPQEGGGEEV